MRGDWDEADSPETQLSLNVDENPGGTYHQIELPTVVLGKPGKEEPHRVELKTVLTDALFQERKTPAPSRKRTRNGC